MQYEKCLSREVDTTINLSTLSVNVVYFQNFTVAIFRACTELRSMCCLKIKGKILKLLVTGPYWPRYGYSNIQAQIVEKTTEKLAKLENPECLMSRPRFFRLRPSFIRCVIHGQKKLLVVNIIGANTDNIHCNNSEKNSIRVVLFYYYFLNRKQCRAFGRRIQSTVQLKQINISSLPIVHLFVIISTLEHSKILKSKDSACGAFNERLVHSYPDVLKNLIGNRQFFTLKGCFLDSSYNPCSGALRFTAYLRLLVAIPALSWQYIRRTKP